MVCTWFCGFTCNIELEQFDNIKNFNYEYLQQRWNFMLFADCSTEQESNSTARLRKIPSFLKVFIVELNSWCCRTVAKPHNYVRTHYIYIEAEMSILRKCSFHSKWPKKHELNLSATYLIRIWILHI